MEKELSVLELSIAISEQKISQAEIKLYAWNSYSITREGYNTCAICSTETSLLLSECIACAFGEDDYMSEIEEELEKNDKQDNGIPVTLADLERAGYF